LAVRLGQVPGLADRPAGIGDDLRGMEVRQGLKDPDRLVGSKDP